VEEFLINKKIGALKRKRSWPIASHNHGILLKRL
jgi:hypothetical protein